MEGSRPGALHFAQTLARQAQVFPGGGDALRRCVSLALLRGNQTALGGRDQLATTSW